MTSLSLPAGARLPALRGVASVLPDMDFETYSEAGYLWDASENKWACLPRAPQEKKGLKVVGAPVYALHPSTEVLSFYFDLKDGHGAEFWTPGLPNPQRLFNHIAAGGLIEAHNSGFEHWIWNHVCVPKYGWPRLPQRQLRCSMSKSRASAYPGALDPLGNILNLPMRKDKEGTRLLNKFSVPRNPTKKDPRTRIRLRDDPDDARRLFAYNLRDIEVEAAASARIPDLEDEELEFWLLDQEINYRGVAVDVQTIHGACAIIDQCLLKNDTELFKLTGGIVDRASQLPALKVWLNMQGVQVTSLDEEHIGDLMKQALPPAARRALEIRQAVGSSSVKKAFAMRNQVTPFGRLHDLFNYHAARSGRPTGDGPQPTNLPRSGPHIRKCLLCARWCHQDHTGCPWCGASGLLSKPKEWNWQAASNAIDLVRTGSMPILEATFGPAMLAVSGCLRAMFVAAPGHELICSDFSAIEGVVIAALAGEQWRLDVFATHGKIYEASAAQMYGLTMEDFAEYERLNGSKHPLRQKGKVAELALGFGGWISALRTAAGDEASDDELKADVMAWRKASPAIVELWGGQWRKNGHRWEQEYFGLEGAVCNALLCPGHEFAYRDTAFLFGPDEDVLYCRLISGRVLKYHRPRLELVDFYGRQQYQITYEGWNTNSKNGPPGWIRMSLYGGKIAENVVQAVARDIQRRAMINLNAAGYKIVLHVYDENVAEVLIGFGSIEEFERIMMDVPDWCKHWPIKAKGGWRGPRFRKD